MTPTPILAPEVIDAMRSFRRAMSFVLAGYDLAWTRTEDMARPCGVIMPIGQERNTGSAYVRDVERDFEMFVYPPGFEGRPEPARMQAEQVATLVSRALTQGYATAGLRSMRVPLYDYDGIPWDEGQPVGAEPYGFMALGRNFTVEPRPDPDQSDLFTVIVIVTAKWRTDGDVSRFVGPILTSVEGSYDPPAGVDV